MHVQQQIWWIIRAFKKTTEMQETLTWWCVTTTLAWCPCPMWPCGSWSEPGHISQNAYAVRNAFNAACGQTYEVERWLKSAAKEIGLCWTRLELQVCFFEASETFRLGQHKLGANSWLGRTCANDSRPFGCFILKSQFESPCPHLVFLRKIFEGSNGTHFCNHREPKDCSLSTKVNDMVHGISQKRKHNSWGCSVLFMGDVVWGGAMKYA